MKGKREGRNKQEKDYREGQLTVKDYNGFFAWSGLKLKANVAGGEGCTQPALLSVLYRYDVDGAEQFPHNLFV